MTEHDDLDRQLLLLAKREADQLEEANERQVEEGESHSSIFTVSVTPTRKPTSTAWDDIFGTHRLGRRFRHRHGRLVRGEYQVNLAVTDRGLRKMFGYPRLFEDLLSSQPLCFNLFGPLKLDLDLATHLAKGLWPERVDRVTAVHFEFSPGRWDPGYLNNGTAADVLFEHSLPGGGRGVIAIEVKYHEDLRGKPYRMKLRYAEIYRDSGAFIDEIPPALERPPLQQILLDHLLVLAMRETDRLDSALFVLTAPADNQAVTDAISRYGKLLDPSTTRTMQYLTLEDLVTAVSRVTSSRWISDFSARYLGY